MFADTCRVSGNEKLDYLLPVWNNWYWWYLIFLLKILFGGKKPCSTKFLSETWLSPENNVHNKETMLRKMYKCSELLKSVLRKMPDSLIFNQ